VTAPDSLTENPFVMECVSDLMQKNGIPVTTVRQCCINLSETSLGWEGREK